MLTPESLDLARRLLACEAGDGRTSGPIEPLAFCVYEKLRRHLCGLTGVAGFQALASRALTLAKAEAPMLSAVQITEDGSLLGLGGLEPQIDKDDGGTILIAQLLGLLITFIGEALTLRLVQDMWPEARNGGKHELTR